MIDKMWELDNLDFGDLIVGPMPPYGSVTIIEPIQPIVKA